MDLLQKELQRKKKALERAKQEAALDDGNGDNKKKSGVSSSKFLRVGDLRRIQEEQEEEERRKQKEKRKKEQEILLKQPRKRRFDGSTGKQQPDCKDDSTNSEKLVKAKKKKKKKKRRMEGESSIDKTSSSGQENGEQNVEEEESKSASQSISTVSSKQAEIDMIAQFRQLVSLDIAGIARKLRYHVLGVITVKSTLKVLNLSSILQSFVFSLSFYSKITLMIICRDSRFGCLEKRIRKDWDDYKKRCKKRTNIFRVRLRWMNSVWVVGMVFGTHF